MIYEREIDSEKLKLVEEYINDNVDLTTEVKGAGFNMTGNTMSCPFHGSDSTPSLKINGNKWKCFGCGRGGGYIKFFEELKKLDNHKATYYDVIEDYLKTHSEISMKVEGTIYKSKEQSMAEQWEEVMEVASSRPYVPKRIEVRSYDKLIRQAKKQDTEICIRLLAGIQDDLPYPVLENIVRGTDLTGKSLLDLALG